MFGVVMFIGWCADEMSGDPDCYVLYLLQLISAFKIQQPEYVNELSSNYRQSLRVSNPPPPPFPPPPCLAPLQPLLLAASNPTAYRCSCYHFFN